MWGLVRALGARGRQFAGGASVGGGAGARRGASEESWGRGGGGRELQAAGFLGGDGRGESLLADERGMTTAEYAVGTIAAVAFATAAIVIARSEWVQGMLQGIFERALSVQ